MASQRPLAIADAVGYYRVHRRMARHLYHVEDVQYAAPGFQQLARQPNHVGIERRAGYRNEGGRQP